VAEGRRPPYHDVDWEDDLGLEQTPEAIEVLADAFARVDVSLQDLAPGGSSASRCSKTSIVRCSRAWFQTLLGDFEGSLRSSPSPFI
jgi:hypothetical protein